MKNTENDIDFFFNQNKNEIYFKKFKLTEKIGSGAFGDIYKGINILTNEEVALKFEDRKIGENLLETESYYLYENQGKGIVKMISFGKKNNYNILVMEYLGSSLYKIFLEQNRNFTLKDICLIALQCLDRIKLVHSKNIIHCDIKPENFLMGLNEKENIIYLIDFGLCEKYRSDTTCKHILNKKKKNVKGTIRYGSYRAFKGVQLSRRDDLESFGYMILFFLLKKLPWQGIKSITQKERYNEIYEIKKNLNIKELCRKFPPEITEFLIYVRNLEFKEDPDYNYIKSLFKSIMNKFEFQEDNKFSWLSKTYVNDINFIIDLNKSSLTFSDIEYINLKKNKEEKILITKYQKDIDDGINKYELLIQLSKLTFNISFKVKINGMTYINYYSLIEMKLIFKGFESFETLESIINMFIENINTISSSKTNMIFKLNFVLNNFKIELKLLRSNS